MLNQAFIATAGIEAAKEALYYVAPVGEKELYVSCAMDNIIPYLYFIL